MKTLATGAGNTEDRTRVGAKPDIQTLGKISFKGKIIRNERPLELIVMLILSSRPTPTEWLTRGLFEGYSSPSSLPTLVLRARKLGFDVTYDSGIRGYGLNTDFTCDVVEVFEHLRKERPDKALELYNGPFMPKSTSPFAVELRKSLENKIVASTISTGDIDLITKADHYIKHTDLCRELVRVSTDPISVSLNRAWLAGQS